MNTQSVSSGILSALLACTGAVNSCYGRGVYESVATPAGEVNRLL